MPIKGSGEAAPRTINRFDGGVGWIAYPQEGMQRASQALATDAGVILIDPIEAPDIETTYEEFGDVIGVVVLLDRHERDAAAFARRHDVPVGVPSALSNVSPDDTETVPLPDLLAGTDYREASVSTPLWDEAVVVDETNGTLVVPEALGTAGFFRAGDERLGVHPALRLTPPRRLREFDVERVLVGHGEGILTDGSVAIRDAVDNSRRRAPAAYLGALREFIA
ncbi:hypothetical protein [Halosegnis sp.]|uniref:hypothetical protein n=1 Tax=Halosegnis sp. TaxID=2864959 RepID=UPI0035D51595